MGFRRFRTEYSISRRHSTRTGSDWKGKGFPGPERAQAPGNNLHPEKPPQTRTPRPPPSSRTSRKPTTESKGPLWPSFRPDSPRRIWKSSGATRHIPWTARHNHDNELEPVQTLAFRVKRLLLPGDGARHRRDCVDGYEALPGPEPPLLPWTSPGTRTRGSP